VASKQLASKDAGQIAIIEKFERGRLFWLDFFQPYLHPTACGPANIVAPKRQGIPRSSKLLEKAQKCNSFSPAI
jgi:hypothetical protein